MATLAELELELRRERRAASRESAAADDDQLPSPPSSPLTDKSRYLVERKRPTREQVHAPLP